MQKIREVIVVEGRYDKHAVCQAVEATVIETSGFGIFSDAEKLKLLKRMADKCGLIILTDSDSAGFLIRGHLKGQLNGLNVKHAYIPDVPGVERRKRAPSKEGKLGVEGMMRRQIIDALRGAGATFIGEDAETAPDSVLGPPITKADLYEAGLSGTAGSAERRQALLKKLGLPERMSPNALLDVLNVLYTRDEFICWVLS
jgi:ribonuclease M5